MTPRTYTREEAICSTEFCGTDLGIPHTRTREEAIKSPFWELDAPAIPHTRTREEAINAAGNVIGNVTARIDCV